MSEPPETFRSHLPALAAAATGTFIAAVAGSHLFGTAGTKYALIGGSMISGTVSWWGERAIRRAHAIAAGQAESPAGERAPADRGGNPDDREGPPETPWHPLAHDPPARAGLPPDRRPDGAVLDQLGARSVANVLPQPAVTQTVHVPAPVVTVTASPSYISPSPATASSSPPSSPSFSSFPISVFFAAILAVCFRQHHGQHDAKPVTRIAVTFSDTAVMME